jgi:hypothetical protein
LTTSSGVKAIAVTSITFSQIGVTESPKNESFSTILSHSAR